METPRYWRFRNHEPFFKDSSGAELNYPKRWALLLWATTMEKHSLPGLLENRCLCYEWVPDFRLWGQGLHCWILVLFGHVCFNALVLPFWNRMFNYVTFEFKGTQLKDFGLLEFWNIWRIRSFFGIGLCILYYIFYYDMNMGLWWQGVKIMA